MFAREQESIPRLSRTRATVSFEYDLVSFFRLAAAAPSRATLCDLSRQQVFQCECKFQHLPSIARNLTARNPYTKTLARSFATPIILVRTPSGTDRV